MIKAQPKAVNRLKGTLVVIDMQYEFEASRAPDTIAAVDREIQLNLSRGWPVVVVEYDPKKYGRTYPLLMSELRGRKGQLFGHVIKHQNDGSQMIIAECRRLGFPTDLLRVCGVNTGYCVLDTVAGLSAALPYSCIEVVKDACNCVWGSSFAPLVSYANVVLLDGDVVRVTA